jgi:hypothetical protein
MKPHAAAEFTLALKQAGMQEDDILPAVAELEMLTREGNGRLTAKVAAAILTVNGDEGCFAHQLYTRLGNEPVWSAAHEELMLPAYEALADSSKSAVVGGGGVRLLQNISDFGNHTANGGVGALSAILLASAMAGGGLGTLNWHLKQQQNEDDVENEDIKQQSSFYANTARQIKDDIRLRGMQHGA